MREVNLSGVDLNLLPALEALIRRRNVTLAGRDVGLSQPAMSQHLKVLRGAGLIREARAGRHVNYTIDPAGLAPLADWLGRYSAFWPARIDRLNKLLKGMDQ